MQAGADTPSEERYKQHQACKRKLQRKLKEQRRRRERRRRE